MKSRKFHLVTLAFLFLSMPFCTGALDHEVAEHVQSLVKLKNQVNMISAQLNNQGVHQHLKDLLGYTCPILDTSGSIEALWKSTTTFGFRTAVESEGALEALGNRLQRFQKENQRQQVVTLHGEIVTRAASVFTALKTATERTDASKARMWSALMIDPYSVKNYNTFIDHQSKFNGAKQTIGKLNRSFEYSIPAKAPDPEESDCIIL